jgi:hypothetical protein
MKVGSAAGGCRQRFLRSAANIARWGTMIMLGPDGDTPAALST